MDSKIQTLLDAKLKQIDIELEQELIKIGEDGSSLHLRAQGLAKVKANAKKDEFRAQIELEKETKKDNEGDEAKVQLLDSFPGSNKYRDQKRMAKLFVKSRTVKNYLLASCINPTILGLNNKRRKLNKTDYSSGKKQYDKKIRSRFNVINKFWEPLGFKVKWGEYSSNFKKTNS